MFRVICLVILTISYTISDDKISFGPNMTPVETKQEVDVKIVKTEGGFVSGGKYWNGDFYEFYGIPYASVPKGRDRFKAPLPVEKWDGVLSATNDRVLCPQTYYTGEDVDEIFLAGEEDCLTLNLLVPKVASEKKLLPVVIYVHSGAFAVGNGNMAKFHYLARHDVITGSFNFRLGAIGFNCLGTEDIPGNAGMKDAVAALRWINRNIKNFGGDPNQVTLAGFSVGATMAELLALSKTTDGLIDKLLLESGSALSPYAINRHPIATALNIAKSLNYTGADHDLESLADFYINAKPNYLAARSLNFFLGNSTFGFAPCIENKIENVEAFLTESPLDIVKKGDYKKLAVLTGYANMEGLSRALKFDDWSEEMNKDFYKFLPADLQFDNEESIKKTIDAVKAMYFNYEEVTPDNLQGYIDYFSDAMFKYPIIRSANYHAANTKRPVYLYEFAFHGSLNMKHNYMDRIKGASHRDQSSYVLDFFGFTYDIADLIMRDRMTSLWSDFVMYEDPARYESAVVDFKWRAYSNEKPYYLLLNLKTELRKDLSLQGYTFWNKIYEKYYWTPKAPVRPEPVPISKDQKTTKEDQKTAENQNHKTDTKSTENKPSETKPTEAKPTENKPSETKPTEAKPTESKPTETKSTESKPTETKPTKPKLAETKSLNIKAAEQQKETVPQDQKNNNQGQKIEPDSQKKKSKDEDELIREPKIVNQMK